MASPLWVKKIEYGIGGLKAPLGVSLPPPAGRYRPVIQSIAVNRYSHPLRACPWVNEAPKFVTVPCQVAHPLTFCQVPTAVSTDNLSALQWLDNVDATVPRRIGSQLPEIIGKRGPPWPESPP
jgi:hypothetical protein